METYKDPSHFCDVWLTLFYFFFTVLAEFFLFFSHDVHGPCLRDALSVFEKGIKTCFPLLWNLSRDFFQLYHSSMAKAGLNDDAIAMANRSEGLVERFLNKL